MTPLGYTYSAQLIPRDGDVESVGELNDESAVAHVIRQALREGKTLKLFVPSLGIVHGIPGVGSAPCACMPINKCPEDKFRPAYVQLCTEKNAPSVPWSREILRFMETTRKQEQPEVFA